MKRGRLPLTALRSFEAAARHRSFTRGAEELFISQAAISRQIRGLEDLLGHRLFERRHRAVVLTDKGETLLAVLTAAFDTMTDVLDVIRDTPAPGTVAVSAEPSFASCWLMRHLGAFHAAFPGIEIALEADGRLADFRGDRITLGIRHGATASRWPGTQSRWLMDVAVTPVAAPEFLDAEPPIRTPADLVGRTLLYEDNQDAWRRWFAAAGIDNAAPGAGTVYTDDGLVLQAAVRGHGIALIDATFATEELADGRLVRLFDLAMPYGAYYLVARNLAALPPAAAAFAAWLLDACSGAGQDAAARRHGHDST